MRYRVRLLGANTAARAKVRNVCSAIFYRPLKYIRDRIKLRNCDVNYGIPLPLSRWNKGDSFERILRPLFPPMNWEWSGRRASYRSTYLYRGYLCWRVVKKKKKKNPYRQCAAASKTWLILCEVPSRGNDRCILRSQAGRTRQTSQSPRVKKKNVAFH